MCSSDLAYQSMFARGQVRKTYLADAPEDPALAFPVTVRSRIVKRRGCLQAVEEPGDPNAETFIEHQGGGRYRLIPRTGRTHQLRVHMNALGIPILDDPVYPVVRPDGPEDFARPLRLLARTLEFPDPITGDVRTFESRLRLSGRG